MKARMLVSTLAATALLVSASPALALSMVAGWDFSQYAGDSFPSLDGENLVNTLDSNYSDLDPTNGAGAESAAFGTMYLNGQFGSTDTNFGDFLPSAANPGSLTSNLDAPGVGNFDSHVVLQSEGQIAAFFLTMTALSASTVVFEADLTSDLTNTGENWTVTFGGRTSTGTAGVQVQLSLDGVNFSPAQQANFTTTDSPFSFAFGAGTSEKAYVRLVFADPLSGQNTFLDNVSISADLIPTPEPSTLALLGISLAGLVRAGRHRV
jgi:hypothetical protein